MSGDFHDLTLRRVVGRGAVAFDAASAAVMSLTMQRRAGLRVDADADPVVVGSVVRIRIGVGPLAVRGSCVVTEVFDEPLRRGFTYRTLPDHVEDGVETFEVVWLAAGGDSGGDSSTGDVQVSIIASSRPNKWITRVSGPLGRVAQRLINARYLGAVERIVAEHQLR